MRKLLSISPDKILPLPLSTLIYRELVTPVKDNLLLWCERSGPDAIIIEELRSSDRDKFRRVGLTFAVNSTALRKVRKNAPIILTR
jgi:hypothetical protein